MLVAFFSIILATSASSAFASHLQGGYFVANVTATGQLQGTLTYLQRTACPVTGVGSQLNLSITVKSPTGQSVSKAINTYATRCQPDGSVYVGSFDFPLTTATFSAGAPDGNYLLTFASTARVAGVVNLANSSSYGESFSAQVRKSAFGATAAPNLGSNVATGIGVGSAYSQNLNASDADDPTGMTPLTYATVTGNANLGPDYDVITLSQTGQITIPASATASYSAGQFYVYKVRVTDSQGDYAERDVLLKVGASNSAPVISGLDTSTPYDINSGETLDLPFSATDANNGDVVTISGAGLPAWASLTKTNGNPATATLHLAPPQDITSRTYGMNFDAVDNNASVPLTGSANIQVRVHSVPQTTLDSHPVAATQSHSAQLAFSSNDPDATFECKLDDAAFAPCTSPQNFTGLANGSHTFQARAVDVNAVADPTPASFMWTVDDVAPDTTLTATPAAQSASSSATFDLNSDESGVSYECSLDGDMFASCSDPKNYTGLADGPHTLEVRSTDAAGNVDQSPALYAWTIDTAAPDTSIESRPPALANSGTVTFAYGSTDVGTGVHHLQCRLDDGDWVECSEVFSGLSDGDHTLDVRAVDRAGNPVSTPAHHEWAIDTHSPDTTISAGPAGYASSSEALFVFRADEVGTFEFRLDDGDWTPATSPLTLTGLADGDHRIEVRAIDPTGNLDATPASREWTVDTVAPDAPERRDGVPPILRGHGPGQGEHDALRLGGPPRRRCDGVPDRRRRVGYLLERVRARARRWGPRRPLAHGRPRGQHLGGLRRALRARHRRPRRADAGRGALKPIRRRRAGVHRGAGRPLRVSPRRR